ncbi:hypothetical protein [Bartonella sp. F02]|uniref:hypothetical protein n=1 Tax=Bartonella sp. F02 TaxID=2967262 RepID=UPI0022A9DE9C|nr:hypothetical protein [Bartonella sp. F02]MCZ2328820.1 hypothetical protein [Bartonella sp. F02]
MKRALVLSLTVHLILLILMGMHLTNPIPFSPQPLDTIPITLAPLNEEVALQQGLLQAPFKEHPAPKPTTKPQEKENAQHVGDGTVDTLSPFKPKEKPRQVDTPPAPSQEKVVPETLESSHTTKDIQETKTDVSSKVTHNDIMTPPEPSKEPQTPKEKPHQIDTPPAPSEEKAAPETSESSHSTKDLQETKTDVSSKVAHNDIITPPEPSKEPQTPKEKPHQIDTPPAPSEENETTSQEEPFTPIETSPEKLTPSQTQPKSLETSPKRPDPIKPQPQKAESITPKVPSKKPSTHKPAPKIEHPENPPLPQSKQKFVKHSSPSPQKRNEKTIDDILALEEKNFLNRMRTQGGGAKRSTNPEASGARKNIGDTTKMAQTLVSLAGSCIQKKLKLVAIGGNLNNRPIVRLQFYLNRKGMIIGEPLIEPLSGEESLQAIMKRQVYAAVFACQPYADLPRNQYDLWGKGFDFNIDPLQETTP